MRVPCLAALLLLATPLLSGCLVGGIERSEWAYEDAGLDDLAATGRTGAGVTIAILDTGINVQHPALDHLVDDDPSNGQLVAFRDFLGNAVGPREAFDEEGHGSHVAGIIAARQDSGTVLGGGVSLRGGAPNAQLVVGRVCATLCDATLLGEAIAWAVAEGADVISMSLGGQFNLSDTVQRVQVEQAVNDAIAAGVVVVASAGNQGPNNGDVESPSDIPAVIAVGSVGRGGQVSGFSSRGSAQANECRPSPPLPVPPGLPLPRIPGLESRCAPDQKPELVAPGEDIVSAWAGDDYYRASGTSQATPFVTAAVALMLEGRADLSSAAEVRALKAALVASAVPVEGQARPHDVAAGYGRIDAAAALLAYGA